MSENDAGVRTTGQNPPTHESVKDTASITKNTDESSDYSNSSCSESDFSSSEDEAKQSPPVSPQVGHGRML